MPEHHTLTIRGHPISFHIYVENARSEAKVHDLERFLARLPDQHLALLYPIFIMNKKPGGRNGGGTWPPELVAASFSTTAQMRNTGVPYEDIEQYAVTPGLGVIGLSKDRWERPMGRLEFTLLHEVGHVIHLRLGLIPARATAADFAGMNTNRCGDGNMMARRVVECYARYICRPSAVYHEVPEGERAAAVNARLIRHLRSAPAFHDVPASWNPI